MWLKDETVDTAHLHSRVSRPIRSHMEPTPIDQRAGTRAILPVSGLCPLNPRVRVTLGLEISLAVEALTVQIPGLRRVMEGVTLAHLGAGFRLEVDLRRLDLLRPTRAVPPV